MHYVHIFVVFLSLIMAIRSFVAYRSSDNEVARDAWICAAIGWLSVALLETFHHIE